MTILFHALTWIFVLFTISCDAGTPAATKYKNERAVASSATPSGTDSDLNQGEETETTPEGDESETPEGEEEENEEEQVEEEAEPTPEELALKARQDGKLVYEARCMPCHGAAAETTLNSRDAAQIVAAQNNGFHPVGTVPQFVNMAEAETVVAFLNEPI
ncbi:MAG: cytochrome c [Pseudobacteriovorax sp.]|nr:cytochrome c [Pseudobacteriovorax sp.]